MFVLRKRRRTTPTTTALQTAATVVIESLESRRMMTGADPTVATLSESVSSVQQGQRVVFEVAVSSPAGATPTGTVVWRDNGVVRATAPLTSSGTATFTPWMLTPGTNTVTATYGGTTTFAPVSAAPVVEAVASVGPPRLTATALSSTSVRLAWTANGVPHTAFEIYRTPAGGAATFVATVPGSASSYVDSGLPGGVTFDYSVIGVDDNTATANSSVTTVLPAPAYDGPAPEPSYPAAFDVFSPPVSTTATAGPGSPGVDEYTRTAGPAQTIAVTAESLTSAAAADGTSGGNTNSGGTGFVAFGQTTAGNAALAASTIQTLDRRAASVTLPASLPADGLYFVWPHNTDAGGDSQYGTPMVINQPVLSWVDQTNALAGGVISVYGTNLTHGIDATHTTDESWLYLQSDDTQSGQWLAALAGRGGRDVNPYKVDFQLPVGLPLGNYTIWVNNGLGGHYSWSKPQLITVRRPLVDASTPTLVVTDLTEDALDAAMAQAWAESSDGHDVYVDLPSGTIPLTAPLEVPGRVLLIGTGQTVLQVPPGAGWECAVDFGQGGQSGIQGVTIDADDGGIATVPVGGDARTPAVIEIGSIDQVITNVTVSDVNPDARSADDINSSAGVTRLRITGSTFTGAGIYFGQATDVVVEDNTFIGAGADIGAIQFNMATDVSVCHNTVQNYSDDPSQLWESFARVFWLSGAGDDIYLGDNASLGLFPEPSLDSGLNGGEQILSEAGDTAYDGNPVSATAATITLPTSAGLPGPGWTIAVGGGPGLGQARIVTAVQVNGDTETLTLDSPWNQVPTAASLVSLGTTPDGIVVYNNSLSGDGVQSFNGSTSGVQLCGFNVIVADNTISNMAAGIFIWSWSKNGTVPGEGQPSNLNYFDLITGNTVSNVKYGLRASVSSYAASEPLDLMLGTVWRDNLISDVRQDNWTGDTPAGIEVNDFVPNAAGQLTTNVFEDNTVTGTPVGAVFAAGGSSSPLTGTVDTLMIGDSFSSDGSTGSTGLLSSVSEPDYATLVDDTWTGFDAAQDALVGPLTVPA